jgi:hypothetical protein
MERTALSFLAGAATITLAVFATGAYTVTFFSLGFVSAIVIAYLAGRLIGRERIGRWLLASTEPATAVRDSRMANVAPAVQVSGRKARPVDDETLYARYQRMPKKEKMRLELEAWNEAFERDLAEPPASDVVSALTNLKVPAKTARAAVAEVSAKTQGALEFDPLFTSALNIARKAS